VRNLFFLLALEFREWMGGEEKINAYCRDLAFRGGKRLAEIFGTKVLDTVGDLTLNMVGNSFVCMRSMRGGAH